MSVLKEHRTVLGYIIDDLVGIKPSVCMHKILMVTEGIALGHLISNRGIEVDRAKIETIEKILSPASMKGVISFLRHAGFYRRFIKDFFKISNV